MNMFERKSGLADELLLAPGAGDGDFALAPGDPDGLAAAGAEKITVLAILHPIQHQAEASVLLIALIDIPGEAAPNRPNHHAVAQQEEKKSHPAALQKCV